MGSPARSEVFAFRLEPVRRMRQRAEDQQALGLSRALMRRAATRERLRVLREEAAGMRRALVEAALRGAIGAELAELAGTIETLCREEAATQSLLRAEDSQVEQSRAELMEAARARKVLDRLEERQREAHQDWLEAARRRQADDLAAAHRLWSGGAASLGGRTSP